MSGSPLLSPFFVFTSGGRKPRLRPCHNAKGRAGHGFSAIVTDELDVNSDVLGAVVLASCDRGQCP